MSLAENLPSINSTFSSIAEGFFKPVAYSVIEQLLWQYKENLSKLNKLHNFIHSDNMQGAVRMVSFLAMRRHLLDAASNYSVVSKRE